MCPLWPLPLGPYTAAGDNRGEPMQSAATYQSLIERLEKDLARAPGLYKAKLAGLAALGFVVLGGAAVLGLAVSAGLVIGLYVVSPVLLLKLAKIIWIPIAFGWMVLRALWVKFGAPDGYRLKPGEAPALEAEVERLRAAAGAPRLDGIIIDQDLNAAAATVPRAMGFLGNRHYLVLGLPLLQLLDREQLAAVIAHEFGHFGGAHHRFTGWIYHVRIAWFRVLTALDAGGNWAGRLFKRFFEWYAPIFNAYSFPLARQNEFQADAIAAQLVGAQAAGSALIRVHLGSERLESAFWPEIRRAVRSEPAPPMGLYARMASELRGAPPEAQARLSHALALRGGYDDTHPTLAQRLQALGVTAEPPGPLETSAAESLLGPLNAALEARFSQEWAQHTTPAWEDLHRNHVEGMARLAELDASPDLDPEAAIEHARLVEDLRSVDEAIHLWRALLARAPDAAAPPYRLGCLLLQRDDAEGADLIKRAMALDPEAVEPGARELASYYARTGNVEQRYAMVRVLQDVYADASKSQRERSVIRATDRFEPHALSKEALDAARAQLRTQPGVGKAWIVRKVVSAAPGAPPHYVVLIAWRGLVLRSTGRLQAVVDTLDLPGSFIAVTTSNSSRLNRRIKKAAGGPTFRQ